MKKILCGVTVALLLAACSGKRYDTDYAERPSSSTVRGSYLKATGTINSFAGLLDSNGYLRVQAIDNQNVDDEQGFIGSMTFSSDDSDFKPIPLQPGKRRIDILIKFGSWKHVNTFNLTVKPNTHYVFRGENRGFGGAFWVESSDGAKSKPIAFGVRD